MLLSVNVPALVAVPVHGTEVVPVINGVDGEAPRFGVALMSWK